MIAFYFCGAAFFAFLAGACLMAIFASGSIKTLEALLARMRSAYSGRVLEVGRMREQRDDARATCRQAMRAGLEECERLREEIDRFESREIVHLAWVDAANEGQAREAQRADDAETFLEGLSQALENAEKEALNARGDLERTQRELAHKQNALDMWFKLSKDVEAENVALRLREARLKKKRAKAKAA
jgi:hypothetical protein